MLIDQFRNLWVAAEIWRRRFNQIYHSSHEAPALLRCFRGHRGLQVMTLCMWAKLITLLHCIFDSTIYYWNIFPVLLYWIPLINTNCTPVSSTQFITHIVLAWQRTDYLANCGFSSQLREISHNSWFTLNFDTNNVSNIHKNKRL